LGLVLADMSRDQCISPYYYLTLAYFIPNILHIRIRLHYMLGWNEEANMYA